MYLMLLMILNHNYVVMTSQPVNPLAVKHPSNQPFANEATKVPCPCIETQFEYSNIKKSTDSSFALTRIKIIPPIELSIDTNYYYHHTDRPLLIEKTMRAYRRVNYDFKRWHEHQGRYDMNSRRPSSRENLNRKFLDETTICHECIQDLSTEIIKKSTQLSDKNQYYKKPMKLQYPASLKHIRTRRSTGSFIWKSLMYNLADADSSLSSESGRLTPTTKLTQGHSARESQRRRHHERLANKPSDLTSTVEKMTLPGVQIVQAHDGINQQKPSNFVQVNNNNLRVINYPIDRLNENLLKSLEQFFKSNFIPTNNQSTSFNAEAILKPWPIGSYGIDSQLIKSLHASNRTPKVFGTNFKSVLPRYFVLAPTKFVDEAKIVEAAADPLGFFDPSKGEFIKIPDAAKEKHFGLGGSRSESVSGAEVTSVNGSGNTENKLLNPIEESKLNKPTHQEYQITRNNVFTAKKEDSKWQDSYQNTRYAANYSFDYRVAIEETANYFGHQESRSEGVTNGRYHVLLPGKIQRVNYRVDNQGYRANVSYQA